MGRGPKERPPQPPTTQGKVERFQQTLKKWLRAQPVQPATIDELQAVLDVFVDEYNSRRPTDPCPTRQHRPPCSRPCRKLCPATAGTPTRMTVSVTTASTKQVP
ncbi:integrase core domain-containing protein [Aeromicrobium sp. A1-2]|uniref:integrase core domain-containing protein n=1 Tax=Aeromicrobium sp. A1-2 TaxID=2107713 RepID=UPI00352C3B4B